MRVRERFPELPARWVKKENLHLTLAFLGNTSEKELEGIIRAAKEVAGRHKPFSFTLSGVAPGPTAQEPRMVWAAGETPKELSSLEEDLEATFAKSSVLSFVPEKRPFTLHITLARISLWQLKRMEPDEYPEIAGGLSLKIPVSSLEVMESKLKRGGAEYSVVESVPL